MIPGTYYFRGYKITISAATKAKELEWIFKKHPEFKDHCGYNKQKRSNNSSSKSKQDKSAD